VNWITDQQRRWDHAAVPREAKRPVPTPLGANAAGRYVVPLDRANIRKHFKGARGVEVNTALRQGRWKPDQRWLDTMGAKYGRLLIVSDMHPSTGKDKVTRKVKPAEDFKPNMQEVDFRNMMQGQWKESARDRKVRTLVLNGDCFEFMQTTRTAVGGTFTGKHDRYGPLNTPSAGQRDVDRSAAGDQARRRLHPDGAARGGGGGLRPQGQPLQADELRPRAGAAAGQRAGEREGSDGVLAYLCLRAASSRRTWARIRRSLRREAAFQLRLMRPKKLARS
jgi:hypothetical protein